MDGARCVHIERHSTAPILPSYRRTSWVRLPRAAHYDTRPTNTCLALHLLISSRDTSEGASSISRGGVLAHRGGFGTFGWTDVGCWNDSESEDATGPAGPGEPDSNSKSTPAAFGTSRPTRMPPAQEAIGPPARGSSSLGGQATSRGLDYPVARGRAAGNQRHLQPSGRRSSPAPGNPPLVRARPEGLAGPKGEIP